MTDEKLLVTVLDIDVSGQLTQGWWDLPNTEILNTNDYSEDEVLVFANRNFIKYFDGIRTASWGGTKHKGVFNYHRPVIRKKGNHFQIRIVSNIERYFLDSGTGYKTPWEGVKLKDVLYYGLRDKANLQNARLRLKIVVPLKKIDNIPEYGIAVYDENGNCKYCNSTDGYARQIRIHHTGISSFSSNKFDTNEINDYYSRALTTKLNANEYVLMTPLGYFDSCYQYAGGRGHFMSGEILPAIAEDGTVSVTAFTEFSVIPKQKRAFPSQASDEYTNDSIINPILLIAEF